MRIPLVSFVLLFTASLAAQTDFQSPEGDGVSTRPFQLGIFGFAARAGVDFEGQGQALASFALDMGDLYTDRLRLRPSAELGFGWGDNTYVANVEVVYRFTADTVVAVPYVGGGVALSGQEGCGAIDDCPSVWAQFVLGFELKLRNRINWLLEYHAEDAFRRHRLFVGLTTRRGM
jgi:hypothetical protein